MNLTAMAAVFCVLLVALLVTEIVARTTGKIATLGTVLTRLMRYRATQVCVLLVWWWLGWHFLAD